MFGAKRFENKNVWITGGGSGIGRNLALEFAKRGANVAVSGRREKRLEAVVKEVEALGVKGLALVCDVTDEQGIAATMKALIEEWGTLDVAVANAGFAISGKISTLSAEDWRRQLDVNVVGAAMTAKYAIPHLKKTKGRLSLISSVAGLVCYPGGAAYGASKFACRAIGLTLAQEVKRDGVSVTVIYPGFVESEIGQVDREGLFHEDVPDRRPQRFMWKGEKAGRVMADAIHRRELECVFTAHGKLGAFLGMHTPKVVHMMMTRSKVAQDMYD